MKEKAETHSLSIHPPKGTEASAGSPPANTAIGQSRLSDAIKHGDRIYQLMVDSVRDYAIFMLDPNGHIASWNKGAQRLKGYTADEIIGRHFSEFYPQEDVVSGKPARELTVATAEGRFEDEGFRVRKDGSTFWANVIITAVGDAEGALLGFVQVTPDLTERRAGEEENPADAPGAAKPEAAKFHTRENPEATPHPL